MTSNELVQQINQQDITGVKVDLFQTFENGLEAFAYIPLQPHTAFLRFPVTNYNTVTFPPFDGQSENGRVDFRRESTYG